MAISSISNMLNNKFRMSGLSSGLDTDSIIQSMLQADKLKIDRAKQDKTLLQWRQDSYRDITNALRGFKDTYFDVLKPASNFRSPSAFASFNVTNVNSADSSKVTATAGAGAIPGTHEIVIKQLAEAASITGVSGITKSVAGSPVAFPTDLTGKQINVTLDGTTKTIDLGNYASGADFKTQMDSALTAAFGANKIVIDNTVTTTGVVKFNAVNSGSTVNISEPANNFINTLGFTNLQQDFATGSSDVNVSDYSVYNGGKFKITYGGTEYTAVIGRQPNSVADLASAVQDAVNGAIGGAADQVKVSANGNKLAFTSTTGKSVSLTSGPDHNVLDKMGFASGTSFTGTGSIDITDFSKDETGKTFYVNDGTADRLVKIDTNVANIADLAAQINTDLTGFGISVTASGNKLVFAGAGNLTFKTGPQDALSSLGFSGANTSNNISLDSSLSSIKSNLTTPLNITPGSETQKVQFTINGTTINVNKDYNTCTLRDVISAVNTSAANVTMQYDSLQDRFVIASKSTGVASQVNVTNPADSNLFTAIGITGGAAKAGVDAIFKLDNVDNMTRSSNEFAISGITYSLKAVTDPTAIKIDVKADPDALLQKIKGFVDKYNELITKINTEVAEKKDRSYLPLTDDQKSAMKEEDIKSWEEKAKTGILYNDSIVDSIQYNMRKALSDPITTGVSTTLAQIGITTGPYSLKGMLIIDETKLKDAISANPDSVAKLFTQESSVTYEQGLADSTQRTKRYNESGIAQRLYDILQDNIRTTRDTKGQKGVLLEKAGITGDISEFQNSILTDMDSKDTLINTLMTKIQDKQERLYKKFSALETALSQMNNQSAWLSQQTGGGQ